MLDELRRAGDPSADAVIGELARTRQIRAVSRILRHVGRAPDRGQSARGPIGSLTKLIGAGMLNQRVAEMAGGRSASFSIPIPSELERNWTPSELERSWTPSELERSWTASGVFPAIDTELIQYAQAQPA